MATDLRVIERDREWMMGAADSLLSIAAHREGRSFDHTTKRSNGECALCSTVADELTLLLTGTRATRKTEGIR